VETYIDNLLAETSPGVADLLRDVA